MAEITAAMVKELRERTGAGMMDCKKALEEAGGDAAKAIEVLQKKAGVKNVKAAGKIAAEGAVFIAASPDATGAILLEVNCQTDFVARGDEFRAFSTSAARTALAEKLTNAEALLDASVDGKTFRARQEELTAKSGEKHAIRRLANVTLGASGAVGSYVHHNSRIGVLVEVGSSTSSAAVREFAEQIAIQVASMNPRWVRREEVPEAEAAKQKEIFRGQMENEESEALNEYESAVRRAKEEGKEEEPPVKAYLKDLKKKADSAKRPAEAKAKIVDGRYDKWLRDLTLLDQTSVIDSDKTIAQALADFSKAQGATEIKRFVRFEVGEGIDRGEAKDFAAEVAEMAAAASKN